MLKTTRLAAATAAFCLLSAFSQAQNTFPTSGNVGVGTTSPAFPLEVGLSSINTGDVLLNVNGRIQSNSQWGGLWLSNGINAGLVGTNADNIGFWIPVVGWNAFQISKLTGNVGVGTQSPGGYKLAVAGKIGAWGEVRVFANGSVFPDYVFEPGYTLPSLAEVEQYVKQNKHLPEVPSAKEVEKEGMSLNEMNVILLKKVEELTLHLIEQEKRIKELEQKIANK